MTRFNQPLGLVLLALLALAGSGPVPMTPAARAETAEAEDMKTWAAFELDELQNRRDETGRPYLPFLEVPAMSVGLYELEAGAKDGQSPHDRDEIYYVVSGRARLAVGDDDVAVGPGSTVYVERGEEHRFHSIEEKLTVLVVFAPGGPAS